MAEISYLNKSADGAMSAGPGDDLALEEDDLALEENARDHDDAADRAIVGWLRHQQHSQSDDAVPDDGRPLRLAVWYFVLMILGVGSAFAWHASPIQSTIRTAARGAMRWSASFVEPTSAAAPAPAPTKPQPTRADLAQRIDALTNEIGALKQQVSELNSAQAQSAKSAAEEQLKVLALQQLLAQKAQPPTPKTSQADTAVKEKRVSALPKQRPRYKPEPKPKPLTGMPLRLGPASTAQR